MMITEVSSFEPNLAKRQGSMELPHDIDRNEDIFQPNKGNSKNCTQVPEGSLPVPKGDSFFYKRRRLSRGGVAVLQEKKPQDQSSDFVSGPSKCTTSTSLPSKSSKNTTPVKKLSQSMRTHIACKNLCLSILKDNALLGYPAHGASSQSIGRDEIRIKASLPCKTCGILEESFKMLICDSCEAAYHLSCCNADMKILGEDQDWFNWHCLPCSLSKKAMQSSREVESSRDKRNISKKTIHDMLVDKRSYRTPVRLGIDFQADVPEWAGPVNEYDDSSDYFSKPKELDVTDDSTSKLWCVRPKPRSFGNWVQCQEIIDASDNGNVVICGKWRRVPLEVVQTDDWDCSCLLPHDPFHADCAVPQEAENEEIIKQLKVLEMARQLLEKHTKKS